MDETRLRERLSSRYLIEREIGRGGMATVYLAHDVKHDRHVAIKVLHEDLSAALGVERFRREIQIASHLAHPNILPVHDSGDVDESLFLVMPYIEGESLRARIERERQLALDDAVQIAVEVSGALDFAHRQGVIHRDIKPENILLGDGHAYVADFGIARAIKIAGTDRITRTGITLGTPLYMSPEQAAAQQDLDGRSDIYSLGCCVYEMLAGTPPFTGSTSQVIIARHTLEEPPSLIVARRGVPEHVEATVMRALEKAPADRFKTAAEFGDALSGRRAVTMPRMSRANLIAATRPNAAGRRRKQIATIAFVAVGAAAVAGWLWRNPRTQPQNAMQLDPRRVAVLYFEDGSAGKLGYLADGLTEALIDRLRNVHALSVISPNGVRAVRDQTALDSVGRRLGVGTIVQGSIQPIRGDSVRVTVRLVEGMSGVDFKRTSFTGAVSNPLRLRDDLAERAATFLRARLGEEIRLQTRRAETKNAEAWGLVQQAERVKNDAEELAAADSLTTSAARFARADSMLASAESLDPRWIEPIVLRGTIAYREARLENNRLRASDWITRGLDHVGRALAIDARNADALELRGTLRYLRWLRSLEAEPQKATALLKDAEADLRAAVSISPTNASAWSTLSHLHYQKPDFVEAKLAAQRAYEEDAYLSAAPDIVWRLYTTSYDLEDFSSAAQWCAEGRKRFGSNPRFLECQLWLMTAPDARPDLSYAWRLVDSLRKLTPPDRWPSRGRELDLAVAAAIARAAVNGGGASMADSARHVADRSHASRKDDPEGELLGNEAFVQVILGDKAHAIRLLKEYFALNPSHRALFAKANSWWWRPLRDDAAYADLVGFSHR